MSEYNDICLLEDEEKEESGPSSSTSQSTTEEIPCINCDAIFTSESSFTKHLSKCGTSSQKSTKSTKVIFLDWGYESQ